MACITLLSDLGLQDASVAVARGIFMQHAPGRQLVDISHDVMPFHTGEAAYLLDAAYKNFAPGTCHIILFDLFSSREPKLILCEHDGHYFVAPDNGVLPLALGTDQLTAWHCHTFSKEQTFIDWLQQAGRVLPALSTGSTLLTPLTLKPAPKEYLPEITLHTAHCDVAHIDRFENVVLNIRKRQFDEFCQNRLFSVQFREVEQINEISAGYTDVKEGNKLLRFNSNGYLEISINRGKAASLFGLRLGGRFNDIKIVIE